MARSTAALGRNLSRLELALAIVVIAVLAALFMRRMTSVEQAAEEAWLATRVQYIQSHLMTLRLTAMSDPAAAPPRDAGEVVKTLGYDDIHWFEHAAAVDWAAVPPGEWVYLRTSQQLLYRPASAAMPGATGAPPRVTFQLTRGGAATASASWRIERVTGTAPAGGAE